MPATLDTGLTRRDDGRMQAGYSITFVLEGAHLGPVHAWRGAKEIGRWGYPIRVADCGLPLPLSRDDGALQYQHVEYPHHLKLTECPACWRLT